MSRRWILLLTLCLWTSIVSAATIYVDNSVTCNGSGTTLSPYCSIQLALNAVAAGDTIRIRTGTGLYQQFALTNNKDATAGARITIEPDTGMAGTFVLRNCQSDTTESALQVKNSDYWTFQNLVFDGAGCPLANSLYALKIQGDTDDVTGVWVLNNTFRNWTQVPGATNGPNVLYIAGCDPSFGCSAHHFINGIVRGNLFQDNDLISLKVIRTQGTLIENNEIVGQHCGRQTSGAAETLGIHATYSNANLTVRNNTIHDFDPLATCALTSQGFHTVAGYWCDVGGGINSGNVIEANQFYNMDQGKLTVSNPAGIDHVSSGIFIEAQCAGNLVKNNLIYGVMRGLRNSYHATGATTHAQNRYYYNTVDGSSIEGFYLKEGVVDFQDNIVSNSTSVGVNVDAPASSILTADYNDYTGTNVGKINPGSALNLSAWKAACGCDSHSLSVNPQFVGSGNYRLASTSPVINVGVCLAAAPTDILGVVRPDSPGGACDMGAYEFGSGVPPIPLPGITLLPAPTQVGSIRQGGTLQGGTR